MARPSAASGRPRATLTSAIAEGIAGDKDLTKSLLKSVGVPVPEGQVVNSPAEAWEAAQDIGLPVVGQAV